jgi:hypothetical protein
MIDNTINDDKTIAGGENMILAGRHPFAGIQRFNRVRVGFFGNIS